MGVIYKITSPTGKLYVGQTRRLSQRKWMYKHRNKKSGLGKSIIMNSIYKYGWDAHIFEIIEECGNEILSEREIFWIEELKTFWQDNSLGMNMSRGGEDGGKPWMHDLERRIKQSKRFKGEGGTFYGKHHTDEAKKIIAEKNRIHNLLVGKIVPKWGTEKGREVVMKWIIAYGNDGNFISEFRSLTLAAKELKINISCIKDSLKYGNWVFGKYLFKYKSENYPLKIEVGEIKVKQEKRGVWYLDKDYKPIKKYESSNEASADLNVPKTTINRSALSNWLKPIMSGHIFIYKDLYKEALRKVKKEGVKKARNQEVKSEYHYKWYRNKKASSPNISGAVSLKL